MEAAAKKKGKRSSEQPMKAKKRKHDETGVAGTEKENHPEEQSQPGTGKERSKKPHKKRQKGLYKKLAEQLEFYFSDANLRKDRYMMQMLEKDPWVSLSEFGKFNRILSLVSELTSERNLEAHLVKSLQVKKSTLLELSEDMTKVKRVTELEKKEDTESCTIYVENIPLDSTHDTLKYQFKQYGDVVYVSIPKFRTSQKLKGFAFIEFSSAESVSAVMLACGGSVNADFSNNRADQLASIKTFHQEEAQSEQQDSKSGQKNADNERGDEGNQNKTDLQANQDSRKSPKRAKLDDVESDETNSEKTIDIGNLHGLTILTKQQWRRLRNQYLNEQRKNISAAKRHIKTGNMNNFNNQQQQHQQHQQQQQHQNQQQQHPQQTVTAKLESAKFEKGLIVKVVTSEQIDNLKNVKQKVRQLDPDVCYIDVKIGQNQFYVRCRSSEEAIKITQNKVDGWSMEQLKGDEETDYHKVIAQDMADKKSGKVVVNKKNKKTKFIEKFEQQRNSHTYFPE